MLSFNRNKVFATGITLVMGISLFGCANSSNTSTINSSNSPLVGNKNEEYYMITFNSGIEYWKQCYKGFEDAGNQYGIKTIYTGGLQYDVNQEVTALEQVIAKQPAGIAITCINPSALVKPIKEAMAVGIPVVTFDADSPDSGRYSFIGTGNEYAGTIAAQALAKEIGASGGEVVIITLPTQQNHIERVDGFRNEIKQSYKSIDVIQVGNGKSDETEAARVLSGVLQAHPNLKGVFCTDATSGVGAAAAVKEAGKAGKVKIVSFDTDRGTLDAIKSGVITASIAQGSYIMGYQSMNFLYQVKHGLAKPGAIGDDTNSSTLPRYVDTGVAVVTKSNVDKYYQK